jgi:hypothetical protein
MQKKLSQKNLDNAGNKTSKKKTWNTNRIIGLSAIAISLFTLFILIYQSRLLSRQFELAQRQQFASVLPYLEVGPSFGLDYFRITLSNTGIGPAFIKDVFVYYNDERHEMDLHRFLEKFSTPEDSIVQIRYSSLFNGRVIQPGAELVLISADESPHHAAKLREFFMSKDSLIFGIEYASVYDERWVLESTYPPIPIPKDEYEKRKANLSK